MIKRILGAVLVLSPLTVIVVAIICLLGWQGVAVIASAIVATAMIVAGIHLYMTNG